MTNASFPVTDFKRNLATVLQTDCISEAEHNSMRQQVQLLQGDHATCCVSWSLLCCCTAVWTIAFL